MSNTVRGNAFLAVLCLLVSLLATAAWAEARPVTDPKACVQAMADAVDGADADSFARLVNMDAIVRQAVRDLSVLAEDPQTSQWLPPAITLMASKGGLKGDFMQNFLAQEVENFVLWGVGSGSFAGTPSPNAYKAKGLLAPLFSMASVGRKEVTRIGVPTPNDKDSWLVPFTVHDDNGRSYDVSGIVSRVDGGYVLDGVSNMKDLILQISLEAQE